MSSHPIIPCRSPCNHDYPRRPYATMRQPPVARSPHCFAPISVLEYPLGGRIFSGLLPLTTQSRLRVPAHQSCRPAPQGSAPAFLSSSRYTYLQSPGICVGASLRIPHAVRPRSQGHSSSGNESRSLRDGTDRYSLRRDPGSARLDGNLRACGTA